MHEILKNMNNKRSLRGSIILIVLFLSSSINSFGQTIIDTGDNWKYLDNGSDQGTEWQAPSFDDNSWSNGVSPLGFGSISGVPLNTILSSGYTTYYFRKTFNYSHSGDEAQFVLSLMVDDGAVVYLNGDEIYRSDIMPTGLIDYLTITNSSCTEGIYQRISIPVSSIIEGSNTFVVEVHQRSITSSDVGFDVIFEASSEIPISVEHIRFGSSLNPLNGLTVTWKSEGINDTIKWGYTNLYEMGLSPGLKRAGYEDYFYDYNFPSLKADSTIYYRLYDSQMKAWTEEKSYLCSVDTASSQFSFLAMGDSRTYVADWQNVSNAANTNNTDFTLFTGDIVNDGSDNADWNAWFDYGDDFLENNLIYHTIGNHECKGNGETIYPNIFTLPENPSNTEYYYSFTFGNAVFICLNTEESKTGTSVSTQYNWLLNVLQENQDKTWKFIWFHRPFYTTGSHAGEMDYKMDTWFDAFDTYGVDMIFSGHDHMYERTKPVQKNGIVVAEYGSNSDQGRCQIVCGGAGAPLYTPGTASWLETAAKKFHYCKVDIDGYDLNFKVYDENNIQFDTLTLSKNPSVSVEEYNLNAVILAYPNPTSSQITIKGNHSELSEIRIYNTQGKDFSSFVKLINSSERSIVIDVSNLPSGMYLLRTKITTYKIYKK